MTGDRAALLWLRAFQRLAGRAAHEVKNPLNGAVLNVEVVRGRAGRPGVQAAALASYADAASAELGRVVALVEALLALARPVDDPVDLDRAIAPLVIVARAVAEAQGGTLAVERHGASVPAAGLDGDLVRGAVAAALEAAVRGDAGVTCVLGPHGSGAVVRVSSGAGPVTLTRETRAALREAGVRVAEDAGGVALTFAGVRADEA